MVAGLQRAMSASAPQGGGDNVDGGTGGGRGRYGKTYSRSHIAQLKGFCRTDDVKRIPVIWYTFSTTKDFEQYQTAIERRMEYWSKEKGVEIDQGISLILQEGERGLR